MKIPTKSALLGAILASVSIAPLAHAVEVATLSTRAAADSAVQFDVFLPLTHTADLDQLLVAQQTVGSPLYHKWLKPAEFAARFGTDSATIAAAKKELTAAGFSIVQQHAHGLRVAGKVSSVEKAFSTYLVKGTLNKTQTLVAGKSLTLTPTLASAGAVIPSFSGVVRMHSHAIKAAAAVAPANRRSPTGGYWFTDLKQAYEYPSYKLFTGKGVNIGILMQGDFNQADMDAYFMHEKLKSPAITTVNVFGGAPYDPNGSFETHLDIQQSGGMAPNAAITLYNVPDLSDASLVGALTTIVEVNAVDVVNMSFGGFESAYLDPTYPFNNGIATPGILTVYDDLYKQGNAEGITFVASSGDQGALAAPPPACFAAGATSACGKMRIDVESPASDPAVTGVGGANLVTVYDGKTLNSAYVRENAYYDLLTADLFTGTPATGNVWGSGGGISKFYAKPSYQTLVNTGSATKRTVPDLALHMGGCPNGAVLPCGPDRSYDIVAIDGSYYGVIGTSASAPDFTGLVALENEYLGGRLGNVNPMIYTLAFKQAKGSVNVYRQNIPGNNGAYSTKAGYNYVLGNGTLHASAFMLAPKAPFAGIPQTPTNP